MNDPKTFNQIQVAMIFIAGMVLAHEYGGNTGFAITFLALALRPRPYAGVRNASLQG